MSGQHAMGSEAPVTTTSAQEPCACPTTPSSDTGGNNTSTVAPAPDPIISADIGADTSGLRVNVDALGHDAADVSIGLNALSAPLALVDGLGCADSGSAAMSPMASPSLLSAAVNADTSGVQAAVDVLG